MKIISRFFILTYLLSSFSTIVVAKDTPEPSDDETEENFDKNGKREKKSQTKTKKPLKIARTDVPSFISPLAPHAPSNSVSFSSSLEPSVVPSFFVPAAAAVNPRVERQIENIGVSTFIQEDEETVAKTEPELKLPVIEEILKALKKTQNPELSLMCEALVQSEIDKLILQKKERACDFFCQTFRSISHRLNIKKNKNEELLGSLLSSIRNEQAEEFDAEDAARLHESLDNILQEHLGRVAREDCKKAIRQLYPQIQISGRDIAPSQVVSSADLPSMHAQMQQLSHVASVREQRTTLPISSNEVPRPHVAPVVQNLAQALPQNFILRAPSNLLFSIKNELELEALVTKINRDFIKPKVNFISLKFNNFGVKHENNNNYLITLLESADFTELTSFSIDRIFLSVNDINKLVVALAQAKKLHTLVLSKCGLSSRLMNKIATQVLWHLKNIKTLDLYGNYADLTSMYSVVNAIANWTQLTHLNLGGNLICEELMFQLASHLPKMTHLQVIGLGETYSGATATIALVNALEGLNELTHIGLNDNKVGEEAILRLAAILPNKKRLQGLGIANNQAGTRAMNLLVDALAHLPQLTSFMINGNQCGAEPIARLAAIVPNLKKLESLNIMSNSAGSLEVFKVAQALSSLSSLKYVWMQDNNLDIETMKKMTEMFCTMKGLRSFFLTRNEEFHEAKILKDISDNYPYIGLRRSKFKQRLFKDELPHW